MPPLLKGLVLVMTQHYTQIKRFEGLRIWVPLELKGITLSEFMSTTGCPDESIGSRLLYTLALGALSLG